MLALGRVRRVILGGLMLGPISSMRNVKCVKTTARPPTSVTTFPMARPSNSLTVPAMLVQGSPSPQNRTVGELGGADADELLEPGHAR